MSVMNSSRGRTNEPAFIGVGESRSSWTSCRENLDMTSVTRSRRRGAVSVQRGRRPRDASRSAGLAEPLRPGRLQRLADAVGELEATPPRVLLVRRGMDLLRRCRRRRVRRLRPETGAALWRRAARGRAEAQYCRSRPSSPHTRADGDGPRGRARLRPARLAARRRATLECAGPEVDVAGRLLARPLLAQRRVHRLAAELLVALVIALQPVRLGYSIRALIQRSRRTRLP